MTASISPREVLTLKQIALGEPLEDLAVEDIGRLKALGYIRDSANGLRVTQEGMMWIVRGKDD
jgi:hypothetical protein